MSNSNLVNYTKLSPNYNPRQSQIRKITIHHMAGNLSVETCGNVFAPISRQASSNYGVGSDGRVGMYVEEHNRAWTSSSPDNDHQAITIEVANDGGAPEWHVSDAALSKTIDLCVDICQRNGIAKLVYTGDTSGNLTRHDMFANTNCPGPYLGSKFSYIADEVNKRLGAAPTPQPTPAPQPDASTKYGIGTQVCTCRIWESSTDTGAGYTGDWQDNITRVIAAARHPYLLGDGIGWTDDASIDGDPHTPGASKPSSSTGGSVKYSVGTPVCTNTLATSSTGGKVYKGDWSGKITRVIPGAPYPYLINDGTGWTNDAGIDSDPHTPR